MKRFVLSVALVSLVSLASFGCSGKVDAYHETTTTPDGSVTKRVGLKAEWDGKTRINIER